MNATVERFKRFDTLRREEQEQALGDAADWLDADIAAIEARVQSDSEDLIADLTGKHRLSQVMVRNRKSVVGGFMPRKAAIWEVTLTTPEEEAYAAVNQYVRTGYARSRTDRNNALGFLMATFQKLNASSSHALKVSLLRRIERLESVTDSDRRQELLEETDLEERPTADALEELLSQRVDSDWEEVRELERIVDLLERIDLDSKAKRLIDNLATIAEDDPNAKVIVFTQFRATQDYLRDHVGHPWAVNLFHGQLTPQEKDASVARFRDAPGPQLLISTEAGGEGRNFQFCHIMVNYDLPWNPMKVEQRIGRIDRIGQRHPVTIFNFSTLGTIEERVVQVLTTRIGVFTETIGGLDPILGEVESDLRKIFLLAEEEARREFAALEGRIQTRVAQARQAEKRLGDLIMDTRSYRKEEVEQLLQRTGQVRADHVKSFVLGALSQLRVVIDRDTEHAGVFHLRLGPHFEHVFPDVFREDSNRAVTFDLSVALEREEVEFLAFGHPIVDGLVDYVRRTDYGGVTSYRRVMSDEVAPTRGWFFVYVLELQGMMVTRELLPVFIGDDGSRDPWTAEWLLERAMTGRREEFPEAPALPPRNAAFDEAVALADQEAVGRLLERQAEIEGTNGRLLAEERDKRERLYGYRAQAARDKLEANRRILDRIRISPEDADRRILPVWEKNVETAERMLEVIAQEREARLGELIGRDHVAAQHELLTASFVSVEPDPRPVFDEIRSHLAPQLFAQFQRLSASISASHLTARRATLEKRREQLLLLARRHRFQIGLATSIADALLEALKTAGQYAPAERMLLNGAIGYFLELEDEAHDLKDPRGFEDDAQVARSVLEVLGHTELASSLAVTPSAA